MIPDNLQRGDYIEVRWLDVCESPNGDTTKATLAARTSIGRFWERKEDHGVPVLVSTTTIDVDGAHDQGWCCYLEAMIVEVTVIKKAGRRTRTKKPSPPLATSPLPGQLPLQFGDDDQ